MRAEESTPNRPPRRRTPGADSERADVAPRHPPIFNLELHPLVMRAEGFEPPSSFEHRDLSPACRPFQHARARSILSGNMSGPSANMRSCDRPVRGMRFGSFWTPAIPTLPLHVPPGSRAALSGNGASTRGPAPTWRGGRTLRADGRQRACPFCMPSVSVLPGASYAYLLGLYLGDGHISPGPRTFRLRFFLDAAYPGIVAACCDALEVIRPGQRAWMQRSKSCRCIVVAMYSNHWPCLFPQHGPGRKHERSIELVDWQADLISRNRQALLRGLIHSDGCRIIANDRGLRSVRYHFSNKSEDIKQIYCDSLDALGIRWTRPCSRQIAVYRKSSVAILDEFIGPKR
jgi:hypothetical protein